MRRAIAVVALLVLLPALSAAQVTRNEPGPTERRANAVTPENPIPRRTLGVTPAYPAEAAVIDANGRVQVRVTLDGLGRVAEARPLSAFPLVFPGQPATPDALRAAAEALVRSAVDAVRQWQYESPAQPPIAFTVTIDFTPAEEPTLVSQDGSPLPDPRAWDRDRRITRPAKDPSYVRNWAPGTLRVGDDVQQPRRLVNVAPVYPQGAQERGIQGLVIVDARADSTGQVVEVRLVRSIPLLDAAAIEAVRQWRFEPTIVDGQAVPVVMTLAINFSLP